MNHSRHLWKSSLRMIQLSRPMLTCASRGMVYGRSNRMLTKFTPAMVNRPMSSSAAQKFEVINVQSDDDFQKRVLDASSSIPVVVDFHATWCGPCKILGPKLESILSEQEGKVVMAKVDIDDMSDLAMEYGVRSVPTVVGVKNGKVLNQFIGVRDDDEIRSFVDKLVVQ